MNEEILRIKLDRLNQNNHYGLMIDTEITKIVRDHIKRMEDNEMKATSVQKIENVNNICFSIENHPAEMESKLVIVASTNDDIFEFEFRGPELLQICKGAGLFTGLEKYQKIRGLEKELHSLKLKKTNLPETPITDAMLVDDYNRLVEENKQLKQENEDLKKHNVAKALKYIEMNNKLRDENEELKYQLRDIQATKEVVEQKINTREGILDQAKKCVCGQREQDYGTPESNFQLIADLWNDYLGITDYVLELEERFMDLNNKGIKVDVNFPKPKTIFPEDVAMMMALLKIARIRNGGGSGDSFVDLAGYAACGGEIWHGRKA